MNSLPPSAACLLLSFLYLMQDLVFILQAPVFMAWGLKAGPAPRLPAPPPRRVQGRGQSHTCAGAGPSLPAPLPRPRCNACGCGNSSSSAPRCPTTASCPPSPALLPSLSLASAQTPCACQSALVGTVSSLTLAPGARPSVDSGSSPFTALASGQTTEKVAQPHREVPPDLPFLTSVGPSRSLAGQLLAIPPRQLEISTT